MIVNVKLMSMFARYLKNQAGGEDFRRNRYLPKEG